MALDKPTFDRIIGLLLPLMGDANSRKALVESALIGCPVLNQIEWSGAGHTFTVNLIRKLDHYGAWTPGRPALAALLEEVRSEVGVDKQSEIDELLPLIRASTTAPSVAPAPPTPIEGDLYVFISYARPDAETAEQVETYLKAAGVRVFRDASIASSENWDMAIEKALGECDRMVLLLSAASMPYRKEVYREWFYFDQEKKPIHPLYIEKCTLHSRMYAYNYIDARADLNAALARLLADLGKPFSTPDAMTGTDRVIVSEAAERRSMPEAFAALRTALCDPKGSVALAPEQVRQLIEHPPADVDEFRLARVAEWSQPRYALDNRFVNLTLLVDQGEDAQGQRWINPHENRRFNDLRDVLAEKADDPALVLLGAPGSGKSTLLRRFQLDDAADHLCGRAGDDKLSFFVALNTYREVSNPRLWLADEWERRYPDLPPLDELITTGRMLFLLDALNEMPHRNAAEYRERVDLWRDFIQDVTRTGCRAIFSCRSLDYSAPLSSKDLRVPQIVVQPMDGEQVRAFLDAYIPAQAGAIWKELDGSPQFDLFRTPYFLKLLIEQADEGVPKGRASLFTGFVRQALSREIGGGNRLFEPNGLLTERDHGRMAQNKWRSPFDLPERGALIPKLSELAYQMQANRSTTAGGQIRVDYDTACDLLKHERDADILRAGVALNVLDEDRARDEVLFFHQLLQEFFAARKLASEPDLAKMRAEWRADAVQPSLSETIAGLADSDPLPPLPGTGWEETAILAAALSENAETLIRAVMAVNLPLAARAAAGAEVQIGAGLKSELQQALIARTQDRSADLRARIAAGEALGVLGDPRFERRTGAQGDYLLPPLVRIAGGTYPIGDDQGNYDDEKPAHTVELAPFQIGRFPVTNAEYALFMAAGGYEDGRWWETEGAQAWRRGEGSTEGQKQSWREERASLLAKSEATIRGWTNYTSEEKDAVITVRNWSDDEFEAWLSETLSADKLYRDPEYWDDARFNSPAQPVVGVTWFEARAYCAWLSAQTGQVLRLPTEAEFEAAARGQGGRKFAYSDTFDSARCNTFESHLRRSTPVGIFDNATPEGAFDLSGNVYTWTSSIYDQERFPYPYRADDGREDAANAEAKRVLRGGSWFDDQYNARAVFRFNVDPVARNHGSVGFRLACSSPIG